MKPGTEASYVSDFRQFHSSTLACLEEQPSGAFSAVSKDGRSCWVVRGALLEVLDVQTGSRVAAWQFGRVLGDEHTSVTCVTEFPVGQSLKLLVCVCNASPTGLLCTFDVALSKVTKAVEIPRPVTEVEVVSTLTGNLVPRWALSEHLRYFCGLVAVGTNTGHVILVDMCTDDVEFFSDEEVPSKLHFISPRVRDIENQRFHCLSEGLHLAMELNESMFTQTGFEYQKPDGLVIKTFRIDSISVTCLKYIPQAGMLVVGYSFGCYQLWKLNVPVLDYSSRLESEPAPVTHITYQEPENDPKNFCYIWIARGQPESDERAFDSVCNVSMYQMSFSSKTYYSNYGVYYDDLSSVCLRMDHELTSSLVQVGSNYEGGSRMISCFTITDPRYRAPVRLSEDESFEESSHGPDLSLCVFVWEATEGESSKLCRHLAIFDINRWYHAQMPPTIRYVFGLPETCAYLCWRKLDMACDKTGNDSLLAAYVTADRLRKFDNNSPMPPEHHFYPEALAFDVELVFETGTCEVRYLGAPRQVLSSVESQGPAILIQPQDIYNLCIQVGLIPRPVDVASVNPNVSVQRECVLTLALEYNMLTFLKACIAQWASGEYEHQGCSLKFLLDWAWDAVSKLKHKMDSICAPLYNWSGLNLDKRAVQTLYQCNQKLGHLISVLKTFVSGGWPVTQQGETELHNKVLVTSLLAHHLSVVMWFVSAGLLPENDDTELTLGGQYCYPATSLITAYKQRRAELANIHSDIQDTDLLMIDGLVDNIGVRDLWDREGGNGQYPPPSLHALLSSYLLDNCDILATNCLVLYLLLDLVSVDSTLDNDDFSAKVSGFARRFNMPQTLVKLVQAFWLLDHSDFQESLSLLLDPLVRSEFSRWQHRRIIKSLLYQGAAKMALRYMSTVRPALTTPEEVKLKLTVLLANGLTEKALAYQRRCRDKTNMQDLLSHLFLGCQQTKTVDRLLQLHLSQEEEMHLVQYLTDSTEPHSQEVLVMHYLQRARFVEAIQLNEKLKHTVMNEASSKARERAAARNAIVEKYASILPGIQRKLLFHQSHVPKKNTQWRREVRRPTPLSTKITKSVGKVTSQSTYIMTIMETLDEIENDDKQADNLDRSVGPFICTPVTPARKSLRDTPVTVYPEVVDEGNTSAGCTLNKSITMCYSPYTNTPTKMDRRNTRIFSASCMTLLQTPTVKKMTPRKQALSSAKAITPQSILKVRNLISTTSPSPRSTNTTPNSQELEGSSRKLPRKLGYCSSTPLSSVPRHLAGEIASQPASPKSVSFVEPGDDTSLTPRVSRISQPNTPKSVSFADKSISTVTKLQPLSTPKQLRFAGQSGSRSEQRLSVRLQGSSSRSPPSPGSPRSVRDRSPTPESLERSPKLIANLDELHRKPLHASPPATTQSPMATTQLPMAMTQLPMATTQSPMATANEAEDLVLRLEEESDGNISDEDVEEMEGSYTSAVSPTSDDMSFASIATVRERAPHDTGASPTLPESPEKTATPSPRKPPSSPTVKISKSPVSEFMAENRKSSSSEHAQSPTSSTEHVQTGLSSAAEANLLVRADSGPVNIDLTDDTEMEVEQSEAVSQSVGENKEIFKDFEEINPPGDIEEENNLLGDFDEEAMIEEEMEVVSTETDIVTSQQEVTSSTGIGEEPSSVVKQEMVESEQVKTEVEECPIAPQHKREITPPSQPDTIEESRLQRKSLTPPDQRQLPFIKVKDSPTGSECCTEILPRRNMDEILKEIDDKFADSPPVDADIKHVQKTEREEVRTRTRRKFDIPPVKLENADVLTPSRSTRSHSKDAAPAISEPVTPTRPVKKEEIPEASVSEVEPVTPSRSTRGRRLKDDASPTLQQPVTPTRSSRRQKMPTQASRNAANNESVQEELVEISATSPKKFSQDAKEAVQDSLLQISQEIKSQSDATSDEEMTKIKNKSEQSADSPVKSSPIRTPTRTRKGKKDAMTPTRSSTRHAVKQTTESEIDTNDENVPVTPTRTRRGGARQSVSPGGDPKVTKATTPRRGQKKDIPTSPDKNNSNIQTSALAEQNLEDKDIISQIAQTRKTPTRGRKKKDDSVVISETVTIESMTTKVSHSFKEDGSEDNKCDSFGVSEIPEDIEMEDDTPGTPSRRQSHSRSCKIESYITEPPKTPTRRQSLGRGWKTGERSPEKEQVRTPTRRQSLGRTRKVEVESLEIIEEVEVKTPTRRQSLGRGKKQEPVVSELEPEKENKLTPSRKGRSKKADASVVETEALSETVTTPSRRGRPKKADTSPNKNEVVIEKPVTPSRRGRTKKADTSPDKSEGVIEQPVTPSRRGRPKKAESSDVNETVTEKTTPSRRGRQKTEVKSDSEEESHVGQVETEKLTPSRKKRAKKEDGSPSARTRSHDSEMHPDTSVTGFPDVFDIQPSTFQFSDPMHVEGPEAAALPKPFTPSKSFIFSPPISHTKSALKSVSEEAAILLPGPVNQLQQEEEPKQKKKPRKIKKLYKEQDEILLISPVAGQSDGVEEGLNIVTRTTRAAAKKAQTKHDGTKIIVQSLTNRRHGSRNSYRFGPVTKKKSES